MLEFINAITETLGWVIVGFIARLCLDAYCLLGHTLLDMWRLHSKKK